VEVFFSEPKSETRHLADKERMRLNCERLFEEPSGLIMVSSSLPGTPSFSDMLGSHFTRFFQQALYSELREDETSWDMIFARTAQHLGDVQSPQIVALPSIEGAIDYLNSL